MSPTFAPVAGFAVPVRFNWAATAGRSFGDRAIGETFVANGASASGFKVYEKRSRLTAVLVKSPGFQFLFEGVGTFRDFAPQAWTFNTPEGMR